MADNFDKPLTLGELVKKLGPDEGIIAEFPNGYNGYLCRYSHLDKSDAALQIVRPCKYDWLSKIYHVKITKYKMDLCDVFQRGIEACKNKKTTIKSAGDFYDEYFKIKRIIYNGPATIIFWNDGTKTVVKVQEGDEVDDEKGILYAALKKLVTKKEYNDILRAIDKTYKVCNDAFGIPEFSWSKMKNLEQEPCEEMISRADMLDAIGHGTTYTTDELQKIIKGLPTVNLNTERSSLCEET